MSETRPITPSKHWNNLLAHLQNAFHARSSIADAYSASSNGTTRRLQPYHHALLESGCQSAKSSPLPHRRLDKLEGTIRDKPLMPGASSMRHPFAASSFIDDNSIGSSSESSPVCMRKRLNSCNGGEYHPLVGNHQESPMPYRKPSYTHQSNHSDATGVDLKNAFNRAFRFDAASVAATSCEHDCRCGSSKRISNNGISTPQMHRKMSPTQDTIGEPGCFSSPIPHARSSNGRQCTALSSPAKSILGDPGTFTSPAHTTNSSSIILDNTDTDETLARPAPMQTDQSVVSGWLKFRDNKRVSVYCLYLRQ